jgi:hypothetical protein
MWGGGGDGRFASRIMSILNFLLSILGHNVVLYNQLVSRMADVVRERIAANKKAEVSGKVGVGECQSVLEKRYHLIKPTAKKG